MIIFFDGMDRCGKDTQISLLKASLNNTLFQTICHGKVPFKTSEDHHVHNEKLFNNMFSLLSENKNTYNFISNRSHISEAVYAQKYRNYSGEYVFEIEAKYSDLLSECYLIVLVNTYENLISREDGLSCSQTKEDYEYEKLKFKKSFSKSKIGKKLFIECGKESIETINRLILKFIN
jgi:thymidylate kinase